MNELQSDGSRVAVVTGAARGMGEAIVRRALTDGYRVIAVDRDPIVLQLASDRCAAHVADVADEPAAREIVEQAGAAGGVISALINVAGIHRTGSVLTAPAEDWDDIMRVNLYGTVNWIRAVLPGMVQNADGVIVNFASVAATRARPDSAAYATSKSAVLGLTRSIALDFGAHGVRCNAISPGSIDTPMFQNAMLHSGISEDAQFAMAPMGRLGSVDEIAGTVAFLLSADAGYLNGANLVVDGGRTIKT